MTKPVTEQIAMAREIAASAYIKAGNPLVAKLMRDGQADHMPGFIAAFDALASSVPVGVKPHIQHRLAVLKRAAELDGGDFAGDVEWSPSGDELADDARTVAIVLAAYDWTIDVQTGQICGLVAGDMGYAATNLKVDDETLSALSPAQGWREPEGWKLVPVEPTRGRLISMAIRYNHAFLINPDPNARWTSGVKPEHRESVLTSMKQLYEEAIGEGFYSPDKEAGYVASFEKAQGSALPTAPVGGSDETV